jgi:hypothetical protein
VPVDRIDRTFLNLVGNLRESDTFGSDNLGTRSWNVRLSEVSDRTYALPDFYDGGTRARITFTIRAD